MLDADTAKYTEPLVADADRYFVAVHGVGKPRKGEGGIRGTVCISFMASKGFADQVRGSIQIHSPSYQRSRPQLWLNDECLTPVTSPTRSQTADLHLPDDDESQLLARQVDGLRQLVQQNKALVDTLEQQRISLTKEIIALREERSAEVKRCQEMVDTACTNARKRIDEATDAADKIVERMARTELAGADRYEALLGSLGRQADNVLTARERFDRFLRRDVVEEGISLARDLGKVLIESPAGDALAFKLATLVAEREANKQGEDVSVHEVRAAMLLAGKAFKARLQVLKTWCMQGERVHVVVGASVEYLLGGLPLEAVEFALENGHRPK